MPERMTISIDEDIRTRLDAHPEINGSGLFRKAVMELDKGQSPEEILAWKEIEIARIDLEKAKMDFELGKQKIEMEMRRYEADGQTRMATQQMELMRHEGERTAEQDKRDADRPATKQEITRAKFEVARAKDILNWLLEAYKATDSDQNRYVSAYADTIVDLKENLKEENITALDAKNVWKQGSEIGQELNRMLRAVIHQTQDQKDPFDASDLFPDNKPNDADPHHLAHVERIQTMINEGKTYDEIVRVFAAENPENDINILRSQIRYWYNRYRHHRYKTSSEEE